MEQNDRRPIVSIEIKNMLKCWLLTCVALVFLTGSIANAQTQAPPPPINLTELQTASPGHNVIVGTVRAPFPGVTAFCVPAIPYTDWYFDSWGHPGSAPPYDSRMLSYTQRALVDPEGHFIFGGLAPGRYIVWLSSDRLLDVLTYGPAGVGSALEGQTADRISKYVKLIVLAYGTATVIF